MILKNKILQNHENPKDYFFFFIQINIPVIAIPINNKIYEKSVMICCDFWILYSLKIRTPPST